MAGPGDPARGEPVVTDAARQLVVEGLETVELVELG